LRSTQTIVIRKNRKWQNDVEYCKNININENEKETGENIMRDRCTIQGEHTGSPLRKLHLVLQWFKTMTTNEYIRRTKIFGWKQFYKKLWQRNYFEHIIRNEQSYQFISNYIVNNPMNWKNDKFYMETENNA